MFTYRPLTAPQYADPVLDKLDIHQVVSHRLFRESCYNHKGNYVKVLPSSLLLVYYYLSDVMHHFLGFVTAWQADSGYHNFGQLSRLIYFPPQ